MFVLDDDDHEDVIKDDYRTWIDRVRQRAGRGRIKASSRPQSVRKGDRDEKKMRYL